MANDKMMAQMSKKDGFIAALDQSGGSTPGALRLYGIPDSAYTDDQPKMFHLVQQMRPMPQLDEVCERAARLGVFGTKMRSVVNLADKAGIAAIAAQQFEFGD